MEDCKQCNNEGEHIHDEEENVKGEIIKLIISVLIFIIAFLGIIPASFKIWLYIVAYILAGYEVLLKSIKNIFKGEIFDENFLMSIATIGAFIINEPVEAVAVMVFYNLGEIFEDIAGDKSKKSILKLMDLKPKIANLKIANEIKQVEPESLKIGDIIVVKPGEKIPVDGIVITGKTTINTSAITRRICSKKYRNRRRSFSWFNK